MQRLRNLIVVSVAVVLIVLIVVGVQRQTDRPSLTALAESAVPFEVALTNQRPSLIEFYANWCTSCQAMADDMAALKQNYGDRVNFVMLNVDNDKWLPEVLRYRIDGIPHFVFLDAEGEAIAAAIGEQPRSVLQERLVALVDHAPLSLPTAVGDVSDFQAGPAARSSDPRSHGVGAAT